MNCYTLSTRPIGTTVEVFTVERFREIVELFEMRTCMCLPFFGFLSTSLVSVSAAAGAVVGCYGYSKDCLLESIYI